MNLQEARASAPQKVLYDLLQFWFHISNSDPNLCQMEVENSRALLNQGIRGQHALISSSSPMLNQELDQPLSLKELKSKPIEPPPSESETESLNETDTSQIKIRKTFNPADLSIDHNIDDDVTQETALAFRIDMLYLQRKVMRITASVLTQSATHQQRTSTGTCSEPVAQTPTETRTEPRLEALTKPTKEPLSDLPAEPFTGPNPELYVDLAAEHPERLFPLPVRVSSWKNRLDKSVDEIWPQDSASQVSSRKEVPNLRHPVIRSDPVIMTDPLGRKWVFPYEECRTVEVSVRVVSVN